MKYKKKKLFTNLPAWTFCNLGGQIPVQRAINKRMHTRYLYRSATYYLHPKPPVGRQDYSSVHYHTILARTQQKLTACYASSSVKFTAYYACFFGHTASSFLGRIVFKQFEFINFWNCCAEDGSVRTPIIYNDPIPLRLDEAGLCVVARPHHSIEL